MTAIILASSVPQAFAISDREVSWEESALALICINVSRARNLAADALCPSSPTVLILEGPPSIPQYGYELDRF